MDWTLTFTIFLFSRLLHVCDTNHMPWTIFTMKQYISHWPVFALGSSLFFRIPSLEIQKDFRWVIAQMITSDQMGTCGTEARVINMSIPGTRWRDDTWLGLRISNKNKLFKIPINDHEHSNMALLLLFFCVFIFIIWFCSRMCIRPFKSQVSKYSSIHGEFIIQTDFSVVPLIFVLSPNHNIQNKRDYRKLISRIFVKIKRI